MVVKCICVDDSSRPNEIPTSKWIKKGNEYTILYTTLVLPQKELGVHLSEINLTENELPYEYFLAKRFSFTPEELMKLLELIRQCNDSHFSINELLNQTKTQENGI